MKLFKELLSGVFCSAVMFGGSNRALAVCESVEHGPGAERARIEELMDSRSWTDENFRFLNLEGLDGTTRPYSGVRVDLGGARLPRGRWRALSLVDSNARRVLIDGSEFGALHLTRVQLQEASFSDVKTETLELIESEGFEVSFKGAQIDRLVLRGSRLDRSNWSGVRVESGELTAIPLIDQSNWVQAYLKDLRLSDVRFLKSDLSHSTLQGVRLERVTFDRSNLSGIKIKESSLHDVVFADADLRGADLAGIDLSSVRFQGQVRVDCRTRIDLTRDQARERGLRVAIPTCGGAE